MADDNQQSVDPAALENNQWEEKEWQAQIAYAKNVLAGQEAQSNEDKAAALQKKLQAEEAAEDEEGEGSEDEQWARRLAAAKNRAAGEAANPNEEDLPPEDIQKKLKQVAPIDKKIKEAMKKTGKDYYVIYFILLITGGLFDVLGVICDILGITFWINFIISPIYFALHWGGLKFANLGISSKEQEEAMLRDTFIAAGIGLTGIPTRVAKMIREFRIRQEIGKMAEESITKLKFDRHKILGSVLSLQYPPPKK